MADNSTRIAQIEAILRAGVTRVVNDGLDVTYDFDELRRELRELRANDDTQKGRRPVASSLNLGGF